MAGGAGAIGLAMTKPIMSKDDGNVGGVVQTWKKSNGVSKLLALHDLSLKCGFGTVSV